MVLHILSDSKFTDYVINQFSADEMHSEFVVIPSGSGHSFTKNDKVNIIKYPSKQFSTLLSNFDKYSGIILHGLFWPYDEDIINSVPKDVKIAWYFWGGEIYSHVNIMYSFLAPVTSLFYRIHLIRKSSRHDLEYWRLPLELFKKIDYCLTSEYEEYEFAKNYTNSEMKFLWYTCYSLEETIGSLINERSRGENIMFCNSAAVENNMFDALFKFCKLSYRKRIKGRKVIMPLSYGAIWIKNLMLRLGPLFFDRFEPLTAFKPRDEYNKIMLDCSTLILPYYSPAGQGNIITALWLGMRVYLSKKSIAFRYFRRIGIIIYSFEDDFIKYGCNVMSEEHVTRNREILKRIYSKTAVLQSVRNLINTLEK